MPTEQQFQNLVLAVDQQKGELLYLESLFISIIQAMSPEIQASAFQYFLKASESAKRAALFSQASEDVISTFDAYVEAYKSRNLKKT